MIAHQILKKDAIRKNYLTFPGFPDFSWPKINFPDFSRFSLISKSVATLSKKYKQLQNYKL